MKDYPRRVAEDKDSKMETYDNYRKRRKIKPLSERGNAKEDKAQNLLAIQAAVSAELLMQDPNWDPYLQRIKYAIEEIEKRVVEYKEQLQDYRMVDQNSIMSIKIRLADYSGQLLALQWALELPKDIQTNGDLARKLHNAS